MLTYRQFYRVLVLMGLFFWVLLALSLTNTGEGLLALWFAAQNFDLGATGLYAGSSPNLDLSVPANWAAQAEEIRFRDPLSPYTLPPLWAWLTAHLISLTDFRTFLVGVSLVNTILIVSMTGLVLKLLQPMTYPLMATVIAILAAAITPAYREAIDGAELQIAVAFLMILAIERERAGYGILAGAALALAAALAVYPAAFAVIWACTQRYRAPLSFVFFAAIFVGVSNYVIDPSLHLAYLNELRAAFTTLIYTPANHSIDPLIAAFGLGLENMTAVQPTGANRTDEILVFAKPENWVLANLAALGLTILVFGWIAHKTKLRDPLIWPAFALLLTWLTPASWHFHYLFAFAFLPAFADRFGTSLGGLFALVLIATASIQHDLIATHIDQPEFLLIGVSAGILLAFVGFLIAASQPEPPEEPDPTEQLPGVEIIEPRRPSQPTSKVELPEENPRFSRPIQPNSRQP